MVLLKDKQPHGAHLCFSKPSCHICSSSMFSAVPLWQVNQELPGDTVPACCSSIRWVDHPRYHQINCEKSFVDSFVLYFVMFLYHSGVTHHFVLCIQGVQKSALWFHLGQGNSENRCRLNVAICTAHLPFISETKNSKKETEWYWQ